MIRLVVVLTLLAAVPAYGQELRRDASADGVRIGAAAGAGLGVLTSVLTDVCSMPACVAVLGMSGAAIGLAIDRNTGARRALGPNSPIDDPLMNGALVGAAVAAVGVMIDRAKRCGAHPKPVTCTRRGMVKELVYSSLWTAAIGSLIDAAIAARSPARQAPGAGPCAAFALRIRF